MNDILPCPFCGSPGSIEEVQGVTGLRFSVGCDSIADPDCMGYQSFTTFDTRGEAVKAWNRRAPTTTSDVGPGSAWQKEAERNGQEMAEPATCVLCDGRKTVRQIVGGQGDDVPCWKCSSPSPGYASECDYPEDHEAAESLLEALTNLREAQKAYMADRGNDALGKMVAQRAQEADVVLSKVTKPESP